MKKYFLLNRQYQDKPRLKNQAYLGMAFTNNVLFKKGFGCVYRKYVRRQDDISVQREVVVMRKRDKGFWIAYLVFAIIMLLIYKYIPAENRTYNSFSKHF